MRVRATPSLTARLPQRASAGMAPGRSSETMTRRSAIWAAQATASPQLLEVSTITRSCEWVRRAMTSPTIGCTASAYSGARQGPHTARRSATLTPERSSSSSLATPSARVARSPGRSAPHRLARFPNARSRSSRATSRPHPAAAPPKSADSVLLPTPPLPETSTMTGTFARRCTVSPQTAPPSLAASPDEDARPSPRAQVTSSSEQAARSAWVSTRVTPARLARDRMDPDVCSSASITSAALPSPATAAATLTGSGPPAPSPTMTHDPARSRRNRALSWQGLGTMTTLADASQART